MEFEWSETKRLKVLSARDLDFVDARNIFDGRPMISRSSPRQGEDRWVNVAELNGLIVAVVWCWRGEKIRIITLRKSERCGNAAIS
jgi:hypothetical protein